MAIYFYDIDNTNSNIAYSTGWNEYPDTKAYGGSVTSTFSQATASFNFTGSAVSVQCDKLFDFEANDSATFNVDNGPWTPILVSDSTEPYTCWASGDLDTEGQHILNIKNVVGGTPLRIDKITYMVYVPETSSVQSIDSTSTMIDTSSNIPTPPFLPSATQTSTNPSPSSDFTAGMSNKKIIYIGIASVVVAIVGVAVGLAYVKIKSRRSRQIDAIFDSVSYLPSHRQDSSSVSLAHRLHQPEPTYAIPLRNGVGGAAFPSRRTVSDLESKFPRVMPPKRPTRCYDFSTSGP